VVVDDITITKVAEATMVEEAEQPRIKITFQ